MGSWYQTCNITKLPILDYEEVYAIVLQEKESARTWDFAGTDYCKPESGATLQPILLKGTYQDSGMIKVDEDLCISLYEDWAKKIFRPYLKRKLQEIEALKAEVKEQENLAKQKEAEGSKEYVHVERLSYNQTSFKIPNENIQDELKFIERGYTDFYILFIKKNAFEGLVNLNRVEKEVREANEQRTAVYNQFNSKEIENTEVWKNLADYEKKRITRYKKDIAEAKTEKDLENAEALFKMTIHSMIEHYNEKFGHPKREHDNYILHNIRFNLQIGKRLMEKCLINDIDKATLLGALYHLIDVYEEGRMSFTRSSGSGSENQEDNFQLRVAELIISCAEDARKAYEEENEIIDWETEDPEWAEEIRFKYYDGHKE